MLQFFLAIATLQDDLPHFFQKGLSEHSIYSADIVLSDPHYTKLSIHGRTAYLGIAQMLRFSTSLYFDDVLCEITKMRVLGDDEPDVDNLDSNIENSEDLNIVSSNNDNAIKSIPTKTIKNTTCFSSIEQTEKDIKSRGIVKRLEVRWKLQGKKNATFLHPQPNIRHIEGVFIYKFDNMGYIGEHRIQRIIPPPSRRVVYIHSLGVRLRSLFWENSRRSPVLNPGF